MSLLDSPPRSTPLTIRQLWNVAEWQHTIEWQSFREGVEIHRLYGDGKSGPSAALLRFAKGGAVPLHEHDGFEHIVILSGSQTDDHGSAAAGTLIVNPPGTRHSIVSESGCVALAIYERPVRFLAQEP